MADEVDGTWWRISVNEVLDSDFAAEMLGAEMKTKVKNYYECTTDKLSHINYEEFSKLYQSHPAITLTKTDEKRNNGSVYSVGFSADEVANYYNALPETSFYKDMQSCQNELSDNVGSSEPAKLQATDVAKVLESEAFPQIKATIDGFLSHRLTNLSADSNYDNAEAHVNLNFSYDNPDVDVSAPGDSRSVLELIDTIKNLFQGIYTQTAINGINEEV